jgi:hypothetical protein
MDRPLLLGLAATLNVATAELDRLGLREAANHVNHAVVEIDHVAGWTAEDLQRIGGVQNELLRLLVERQG